MKAILVKKEISAALLGAAISAVAGKNISCYFATIGGREVFLFTDGPVGKLRQYSGATDIAECHSVRIIDSGVEPAGVHAFELNDNGNA